MSEAEIDATRASIVKVDQLLLQVPSPSVHTQATDSQTSIAQTTSTMSTMSAVSAVPTMSPARRPVPSKSFDSWLLNVLVQHLYYGDTSLLPRGAVQAKGISSRGYQALASHPDCPESLREKVLSVSPHYLPHLTLLYCLG